MTGVRRAEDAAAAEDLVGQLRDAFESEADAERAMGAARYMRDQFLFLGLRTPDRRRLARPVLADHHIGDERALTAVARALWAQPEREFQYVACDVLAAHTDVASADFLDVVLELITTMSWWDTIDALASHTVGPIVLAHSGANATMDRWVASDDIWVTRAAILHQLTFKAATDQGRLFEYCVRRSTDTDFFIRKAIGWALRTYAATDPEAVAGFVGATPTLAPLSIREATKGIDRARRRRAERQAGGGGDSSPP